MEPLPETSSISTENQAVTSLSTEKSKPFTKTKHDWIALKADYLSQEIVDIAEWAKAKGLSLNTVYRNTTGWQDEHKKRRQKLIETALERSGRKYISAIESRLRAGRLLVARGMRSLSKEKIDEADARDLAAIIKIGSDIQGSVYEDTKPQTQVNVQVNNGQQLDPTTAQALREWVRSYAPNAGNGQQILVGDTEDKAG